MQRFFSEKHTYILLRQQPQVFADKIHKLATNSLYVKHLVCKDITQYDNNIKITKLTKTLK